MTRDEFALNVSRFATIALLLIFVSKLAFADHQDLSFGFSSSKIQTEKTKIDFPYQSERF